MTWKHQYHCFEKALAPAVKFPANKLCKVNHCSFRDSLLVNSWHELDESKPNEPLSTNDVLFYGGRLYQLWSDRKTRQISYIPPINKAVKEYRLSPTNTFSNRVSTHYMVIHVIYISHSQKDSPVDQTITIFRVTRVTCSRHHDTCNKWKFPFYISITKVSLTLVTIKQLAKLLRNNSWNNLDNYRNWKYKHDSPLNNWVVQ